MEIETHMQNKDKFNNGMFKKTTLTLFRSNLQLFSPQRPLTVMLAVHVIIVVRIC